MKKVIMPQDMYELLKPEQSFLSRSDVSVRTAATNSEALDFHKSDSSDLIIARLESPDMNGEELCRKLREDEGMRRVSILLLCRETEEEISRCSESSANCFVTTPVIPAVLLQEAHRLLNIEPRKNCRIPANIRMQCESRGRHFIGMIENISRSGLYFRTTEQLHEGAVVDCRFSVSGSRTVTVNGEVVRVFAGDPESGYGVSFHDISTEAAEAIGRLSGE